MRLAPPTAIVWRRDGHFLPPAAWPSPLRAAVRRIDCGNGSAFFVAAADSDVAESETALVVRLGNLRDRRGELLDAAALLGRGLASGDAIADDEIEGSGSVVGLSRGRPRLAAASTLFGNPRLEYSARPEGLDLVSEPRLMAPLLPRVELDPLAEPTFVLMRQFPGERGFLAGVERLGWGRALRFDGGVVELGRRRTLEDLRRGEPQFEALDAEALAWLDRRMRGIVASSCAAAASIGSRPAVLLSGGLDSSLLQYWAGNAAEPDGVRSLGFAFAARSYAFEVEYARQAARLLGSQHEFVDIDESDYPTLLERAVEALGEPSLQNESLPGFLRVAESLSTESESPPTLLCGMGADGLHGAFDLVVFEILRALRAIRGSGLLLRAAAGWGGRPGRVSAKAEWVEWLGEAPPAIGLSGRPAEFLRWFDPGLLRRVVGERSSLAGELRPEADEADRAQVIELISFSLEPSLAVSRLGSACGIDIVHPYLDEGSISAARRLPVAERYLRPTWSLWRRVKPVQQGLLERHGLGSLVGRRKGGGLFQRDLVRWMRRGCLRDLVLSIERPSWMPRREFERLIQRPTGRLWTMLLFDLYRRRVLAPIRTGKEDS